MASRRRRSLFLKGVELFAGLGVFAEREGLFEHVGGVGLVAAGHIEVAHAVVDVEAVGIVVDIEVEVVEGAVELVAAHEVISHLVDEFFWRGNGVAHAAADPGVVRGEEGIGLIVRRKKRLEGEIKGIESKQKAQPVVFRGQRNGLVVVFGIIFPAKL